MLLAILVAAALSSSAGHAELSLEPVSGQLHGTVTMHVPAGVRLVSYLEALTQPYRGTDVDRLWDYPAAPQGSDFVWEEVTVDGHAVSPAQPLPAGELHVAFRARVPERYGALGSVQGDDTLVAPFPFVVRDARALPVDWMVEAQARGEGRWLEHARHFVGDPSQLLLAFAKRGFVWESPEAHGILRFASPPRAFGREGDYLSGTDLGGALEFSSREALERSFTWVNGVLARYDVPALRWLVAPLRREPAVCTREAVVVSRELYRATPAEVLYKFHRMGLARTAFACAFQRAWGIDAEDADAMAWFLLEVDASDVAEGNRSAKDLLGPFTFIPDIDSLIYAPQMPWAGVYFSNARVSRQGPAKDLGAGPPLPDDFFHERPRGKIFYDKLLDRLGQNETTAIFRRALQTHRGARAVASEGHAKDVHDIVEDFFGPYPIYDAMMRVQGDTVHVERVGPGADAREPLVVQVTDKNGEIQDQQTLAKSADFHFSGAPLRKVALDPSGRLLQLYTPTTDDPRFGDTTKPHWRFTLTQIFASFGFSASELSAGIDFSLRREYDLHHAFGMGAEYDPSGLYASLHYSFAFGPRVTPDQLCWGVGAQLRFERLTQGFAGARDPVYVGGSTIFIGYDDRVSQRTSMEGMGFNAYASLGVPFERATYGATGMSFLKIIKLRYDQGLVVRLRGDTAFGATPVQAQFPLGGRFDSRGFPAGELTRPHRLIASAEYRHELARGFRTNLADIVWIDGIEGALFADASLLGTDKSHFFSNENLFYDVGYGLRLLYDQGGVNPGVLAIDIGVPLKRYDPSRPAVSVFIDFIQSFAAF